MRCSQTNAIWLINVIFVCECLHKLYRMHTCRTIVELRYPYLFLHFAIFHAVNLDFVSISIAREKCQKWNRYKIEYISLPDGFSLWKFYGEFFFLDVYLFFFSHSRIFLSNNRKEIWYKLEMHTHKHKYICVQYKRREKKYQLYVWMCWFLLRAAFKTDVLCVCVFISDRN